MDFLKRRVDHRKASLLALASVHTLSKNPAAQPQQQRLKPRHKNSNTTGRKKQGWESDSSPGSRALPAALEVCRHVFRGQEKCVVTAGSRAHTAGILIPFLTHCLICPARSALTLSFMCFSSSFKKNFFYHPRSIFFFLLCCPFAVQTHTHTPRHRYAHT